MPIYDYDCAACGRRSEIVHGVHADPPTTCPLCGGGPLRKAVTAPAVHFKGTGWAKKERRSTTSKSGASSGSTGDGGTSESKDGGSATGAADPVTATSSSGDGGTAGSAATTKPAAD
jgi:putative FmdB family regulatory protein